MRLGDGSDDRQTESETVNIHLRGVRAPVKALEDPLPVGIGETGAVILDRDHIAVRRALQPDGRQVAAVVMDIVRQRQNRLPQPLPIGSGCGRRFWRWRTMSITTAAT